MKQTGTVRRYTLGAALLAAAAMTPVEVRRDSAV